MNGLEVTGTYEQIRAIGKAMGYENPFEDYYFSESKGLILISEMDSRHLRNALLKMVRENQHINTTTWRSMVKEYLIRDLIDE